MENINKIFEERIRKNGIFTKEEKENILKNMNLYCRIYLLGMLDNEM